MMLWHLAAIVPSASKHRLGVTMPRATSGMPTSLQMHQGTPSHKNGWQQPSSVAKAPTISCCSCIPGALRLSHVSTAVSSSRSACCFAATFESTQRAPYSRIIMQPCGSAGSACFKATSDGASQATRLLKAACASQQACTSLFISQGYAAMLHSLPKPAECLGSCGLCICKWVLATCPGLQAGGPAQRNKILPCLEADVVKLMLLALSCRSDPAWASRSERRGGAFSPTQHRRRRRYLARTSQSTHPFKAAG